MSRAQDWKKAARANSGDAVIGGERGRRRREKKMISFNPDRDTVFRSTDSDVALELAFKAAVPPE